MDGFKKYRRKQIAELRPVTKADIENFKTNHQELIIPSYKDDIITISISDVDRQNGSPKIGDMIARNPKNHLDQWLVAEGYFEENFELV